MNNPFTSAVLFYKNMSFRNKLLLSYVLFVILPVISITSLVLKGSEDIIKEQTLALAEASMQQSANRIEEQLHIAKQAVSLILRDEEFRKILEKTPDNTPYSEQVKDFDYLNSLLSTLNASMDLPSIRVYVPDGFLYSNQRILTFNLNHILESGWYLDIETEWTDLYFGDPVTEQDITYSTQEYLPVYFPVYSYNYYHKLIGVLQISLHTDGLSRILSQINFSNSGLVYLTDTDGNILFHPEASLDKTDLDKDNSLFLQKSIPDTDWQINAFVATDFIMQPFFALRSMILTVSALITLAVLLLSIYNTNYNSKRLDALVSNMQEVEAGNLNALSVIDSEDEIGILQACFNHMVKKIQASVEEKYESGQNLKNMELISLQNQINPHFLYNTLDMIYWAARKAHSEAICTITSDLALFYRKSLSKGKTFHTIKDELEHVEAYMSIQNYRYENRIHLVLEVDQELYSRLILKLLLQPLVENSILHGIMEKPDKQGTIILHIQDMENGILLRVTDDGVGFYVDPTQKLHDKGDSHGYAVRNINQRLHLYYGSQCSLHYQSTPGEGTTVSFLIPDQPDSAYPTGI